MNSRINKNALQNFFEAAGKENVNTLIRSGLAYQKALQTGNQEAIRGGYLDLLLLVQENEERTGVRILESPDNTYFAALAALSGFFQQQVKKYEPVRRTANFENVAEANEWLSSNPNIIVTSLQVGTHTTPGLFANHAVADSVTLGYTDYKKPTGYRYGMCQEERTRLFVQGDLEKYKKDWAKKNPDYELVLASMSSNARGESLSLVFGFGLDRVEHNKLFIVYRRKATNQV